LLAQSKEIKMSWFTNLEKSIAGKLTQAFTHAKDLAEDAVSDVAKAEAALNAAKAKAAEATKAAHDAAIAAVEKAKAETERLVAEAEAAAKKAEFHAVIVVAPVVEAPVETPAPVVEQAPVVEAPVETPAPVPPTQQ
jgi:hypothetical protein